MGTYTSGVSDANGSADVEREYGTATVTKLTGLSYRQLDYLARKGFLRPSLAAGSGSGSRRLYSFEDLVALRTIAKLRAAGVSLGALKSVIAFLRARGLTQPLVGTQLVVDGEDVL
ncbi:MAG: MerR family transcriptional regulator, partial [Actinomycetota bacterium]